jgi:hypothetical protein
MAPSLLRKDVRFGDMVVLEFSFLGQAAAPGHGGGLPRLLGVVLYVCARIVACVRVLPTALTTVARVWVQWDIFTARAR